MLIISRKSVLLISFFIFIVSCQTNHYREVAQTLPNPVSAQQPPEYLAPQSFDMLSQYTPHKYEVLFTDPKCGVYKYKSEVEVKDQTGKKLLQKPENVYCKNFYDLKRSGDQLTSPQNKLITWIDDPKTTEVYFTYFSFSNKAVKNALCKAAQQRNLKIKFVLDNGQDMARADELISCNPATIERKLRGSEGGLGYAHNKFFIINPYTPGEFKIVFSSGNMSSGPVIHHENWNFITTNSQSQFAQAHLCAMKAEWGEDSGHSRKAYIKAIRTCRDSIKTPVEKDVKVFFVPGEGEAEKGVTDGMKTASEYMIQGDGVYPGIETAGKIWIGAHRFFYNKMLNALNARMKAKNDRPEIRIVADDDTFYSQFEEFKSLSDVMSAEYYNIKKLTDLGAEAKFMETNADEHQLHHSKYLIFADKNGNFTSVYTGSANLTGAGFKTNWENSYFIMIPEVVQQFSNHYIKMWDTMATTPNQLPTTPFVKDMLIEAPEINAAIK